MDSGELLDLNCCCVGGTHIHNHLPKLEPTTTIFLQKEEESCDGLNLVDMNRCQTVYPRR